MKINALLAAMAFVLTGCGGGSSNSGGGESGAEVAATEAPSDKVVLRVVIDPACGAKTGYPVTVFVNGKSIGLILGPNYYQDIKVNRGSTAIVQTGSIPPIGVAVGDGIQQVLSC